MAVSIHGEYRDPKKSPWNFEKFQSDLERRMMDRLERDPHVVKWMKRHGVTKRWTPSKSLRVVKIEEKDR